jgi:hypothetical protein
MARIIIACTLVGILSVAAKADETLKFRNVEHITSKRIIIYSTVLFRGVTG